MGKQVIHTDQVMRPIAHFSHAARIGGIVHLGATAGTDAARRLSGSTPGLVDVAAQTRRMFENAALVLGLAGTDLARAVKVKTYLNDLRDRPVYDALFAEFCGRDAPCHVVVGSAGFPLPQAAIELDLLALAEGAIRRHPAQGGAVSAGGRLHSLAGPARPGEAAPAGFIAQCEAALALLQADVTGCGFAPSDLVYLHATLADARDIPAFGEAIRARLPAPLPALSVVVAQPGEPGWRLQIEAVAAAGGGRPIVPTGLPAGPLPGSPAMLAGPDLYVSGQLGLASDGALAAGVEAQTRAAWMRVEALLAAAGMSGADVLRTNNVLVDWRDYAGFNAGYGAHVTEPYPPRATVLGGLALSPALVQVEAIAHRDGANATIVQVR
ncbi:MAG: RidA family protein [Alphaproteobacteria bacterium]|nr:RidA family protein [Alphaproteobacteria bacterium]